MQTDESQEHCHDIRWFNLSEIHPGSTIVIIGKRATGKTLMALDLLFQHRDIPFGRVVSPVPAQDGSDKYLIPSDCFHECITPELIYNVLTRQEGMIDSNNSNHADPRAFLLVDSCIYEGLTRKDHGLGNLIQNAHHLKILLIVCMQYAIGMPPQVRDKVDYVFILRENMLNNRKRLFDMYGHMFSTFLEFCSVLDRFDEKEKYESLVIVVASNKSIKIEDCVFWYKASIHPHFKMGKCCTSRVECNKCKQIQECHDWGVANSAGVGLQS